MTMPYADALHGNAKFIEREAAERKGRADAEAARLKKKYNVADEQEAIRRYKAEYDADCRTRKARKIKRQKVI